MNPSAHGLPIRLLKMDGAVPNRHTMVRTTPGSAHGLPIQIQKAHAGMHGLPARTLTARGSRRIAEDRLPSLHRTLLPGPDTWITTNRSACRSKKPQKRAALRRCEKAAAPGWPP